jgi:2-polyprenyl-6-methoxyphenol hydroxylase-like FAD-dependent oxidoreductase
MRVVVVGAGLGGLTLAHGLRQAGIDVVVYERDGALGRPQGISLHVDDRGVSALRACLPPAHAAMVAATMGGPREQTLTLSDVDGELAVVGAQPFDGMAGRVRPGRQVHRPLLRAVLLAELDDVVRFAAEFTRFEQRADGTVRVWFADGGSDTADVLVGADGIGSAVRRRYLPGVQVVDTGRRMIMGATPLRAVAGTGLPGLIGDSPAAVRVRGTMMVFGVLRFTESPVAARQRWLPVLRSSAVAGIEDYVMWALPSTQERLGSDDSPVAVGRRAKELTADLPPALRAIVAEAWPDVTVALRNGTIPPMPGWPASSVTLIGDAVHLAPGFGGNLAMQDAHRLCQALVEADRGRLDLLDAIGAYEDTMRRNSFTSVTAQATA